MILFIDIHYMFCIFTVNIEKLVESEGKFKFKPKGDPNADESEVVSQPQKKKKSESRAVSDKKLLSFDIEDDD